MYMGIVAEMLGIPSVMIAGPGFVTQAKTSARIHESRLRRFFEQFV